MVAADDPRLAKVGFAKLVGDGVELYAKKHEITMGRLSKSGQVDVVLGKDRVVSVLPCPSVRPLCPADGMSSLVSVLSYIYVTCRRQYEHLASTCKDCVQ